MKTAMQELKSDLLTAIDTSNEALEPIKDLLIKEACQKVVTLTLHHILNRIDVELLEMEKQQLIDAHNNRDNKSATLYYNETFKPE